MENLTIEVLIIAVLLLLPTWRIFDKAGLTPALSLLVLIPGLGIIVCALMLIFSKWSPKVTEENS